MRVGIVYGPYDSPLYCEEYGESYEVINGQWTLWKNGDVDGQDGHNIGEYRVVLRNMEDMGYNKACELIEEAAKKHK